MPDENKNLYYLHDMPDFKVAEGYTDVRNWKVEDADNRIVGTVTSMLVNKQARQVVYLDVEVDNSLIEEGHEPFQSPAAGGTHEYINKEGDNHLIIPIGIVRIDKEQNKVHTDAVDRSTFAKTRRFSKGAAIGRSYELEVLSEYFPDKQSTYQQLKDNEFYHQQVFSRQQQ